MKKQIIELIDDWISNLNDDLCQLWSGPINEHTSRQIRELVEQKLIWTQFRQEFNADFGMYNKDVLASLVNAIVEGEAQ